MKHLLLCIVSVFNHHHASVVITPKPALDVQQLDRAMANLALADESRTVCVYPMATK